MMTPTRIVRFLGFVGLVAFFGLVASSSSTILAQNEDQPVPPPPPIAADHPKPVIVSQATEEPAPKPAAPAADEPFPLPSAAPEAKPSSPAPEEPKQAAVDLPIAPQSDVAPIPRAPEPVGLDAGAPGADPQPIAESAPEGNATIPDGPTPAASASDDPDAQARSFLERNRKEAEAHLKALNAEAAQLRARLNKIESGIRRWQALADAMDRTEERASSRDDLEPLPHARPAASRRAGRAAVIRSTPEEPVIRAEYGRGADGVFHAIPSQPENDPVTRAQFVPEPLPR